MMTAESGATCHQNQGRSGFAIRICIAQLGGLFAACRMTILSLGQTIGQVVAIWDTRNARLFEVRR